MPTFNVKQLNVPLFGMVEDPNQAPWLTTFASAGLLTPVTFDSAAFDFIADELGLEAEDSIAAAERYVQGRFRAKAEGLRGIHLGDFGEVLTYVLNRSVHGRNILRVESWRAGAGQKIKGNRFPQPDFIVRENGLQYALEVKSTEAFDYQRLLSLQWTWLQPCSGIAPCRVSALPQLGYIGQSMPPQQHSLLIKGGKVVPFPVNEGTAVAVLVQDGRLTSLRPQLQCKSPPDCRQAQPPRDCWSCVGPTHDAVVVSMRNTPGRLSLSGLARDDDGAWFRAYSRWSQALRFRETSAARATSNELTRATVSWLAQDYREDAGQILRGYWGSYLQDSLRHHGLALDIDHQALPTLSDVAPEFEWEPEPQSEVVTRSTTIEDLRRLLTERSESRTAVWYSVQALTSQRARETLAVGIAETAVIFNFLSEKWWNGLALEDTEAAMQVAARLISLALDLTGWPSPHPDKIPLRRVTASVGEREIPFGWKLEIGAIDDSWPLWKWRFLSAGRSVLAWPLLLILDDPRVRLRIHTDGRADLRVERSIWALR